MTKLLETSFVNFFNVGISLYKERIYNELYFIYTA